MGILSLLYRLGLSFREFSYNHFKVPGKLPAKVVSIGNITLGGTGKTPAVIGLAEEALKRGFRPCILTRGYKGKVKDTCFVSKGGQLLLDSLQAGDEAFLMAQTLKSVPVVKGSKRYEAGLYAIRELDGGSSLSEKGPLLFILDDGFQHRGVDRDIDAVLIDGTNPFGNDRLFPEGMLREPVDSLKRADIVIMTKTDLADNEMVLSAIDKIKSVNPSVPIFNSSHKPSEIITLSGQTKGLETLRDRNIYAFSGIANPAHFRSMIESSGATLTGFREFRDHHIYKQKDIDDIIGSAKGSEIVTTEKDLVKLDNLDITTTISAIKITFSIDSAFYDYLFSNL